MRKLFFAILAFGVLNPPGMANEYCEGKKSSKTLQDLQLRKTHLIEAIESTVKLIHTLKDKETSDQKIYNISSTISYGLMGAGITGGFAGVGVTALSGGVASLSLRLGGYAAGSTLRTNTVGIGGPLLFGALAGGGTRAIIIFGDEANCFNADALSFSYSEAKPQHFDNSEEEFRSARSTLIKLQQDLENSKGANSVFNWNGKRELKKTQISAVTNFYKLQLLTLELETVKSSIKYMAANCNSAEKVPLNFDVKSEISKILANYKNLDKMEEVKLDHSVANTITACIELKSSEPEPAIDNSDRSIKNVPDSRGKRNTSSNSAVTPQ